MPTFLQNSSPLLTRPATRACTWPAPMVTWVREHINILAELGKTTVQLINLFTVGSKIDIVKYVVEKLASLDNVTQYINSQNEQGNTPLHWAALNGHLEIVQLLVSSYGADMKVSNTNTDDQQPGL
jgi:ankyrin repeat protein